jgi:hypothetical protein
LRRLLAAALFVGSFGVTPALAGGAELDQLLGAWIAQNVHFEKDGGGRDTLFIRKRPVRAYIRSDHPEIVADARAAVANFADAFGLEYEFTTTNVNMIIATADEISSGGKPNEGLLRSLGLSDVGINAIGDTQVWSTGCGQYDSRDNDGRLSVSILLGENTLPPTKQRACIVSGIVFGFGLRMKGNAILDDSNDYVQFLLLARSLSDCDKKLSAQIVDKTASIPDLYVECVRSSLRTKISQ